MNEKQAGEISMSEKQMGENLTNKNQISGNHNAENSDRPKRKITSRQAVAMAGIILLVLLYILTLAAAIADNSSSARWFWTCLFATMAVPLLIWIYGWIYERLTGKRDGADSSQDEAASDT